MATDVVVVVAVVVVVVVVFFGANKPIANELNLAKLGRDLITCINSRS